MFTGKSEKIGASLPSDLIVAIETYAASSAAGNVSLVVREACTAYLIAKGALRPSPAAQARAELEATLDAGVPADEVLGLLKQARERVLAEVAEGGAA